MASLVISSSVGPKPPPRIAISERDKAFLMVSVKRSRLSPTVDFRYTDIPKSLSLVLKKVALVSTISPRRSSVPTLIISATRLSAIFASFDIIYFA